MIGYPSHAGTPPGGLCAAVIAALMFPAWSTVVSAQGTPPTWSSAASAPAATTNPASQPNVVAFQPGVRINWTERQVELDATVILRQGAIELFACSPRTREHESIICIRARPLHVYQALGLIGLTPGHPIRFDPETGEVQNATGDPVEVQIRYRRDGQTQTEPIERWMQLRRPDSEPQAETPGQSLGELPWVFAGSFPVENEAIAADLEGTVVALVNFASALIALPEYHSDSNAELWLEPNPQRIPPVGTSCTLLLRAGPLRLELDSAGRLRYLARTVMLGEAARMAAEFVSGSTQRRVRVVVQPGCPQHCQRALADVLAGVGFRREAIEFTPAVASAATEQDRREAASSSARPITSDPHAQ